MSKRYTFKKISVSICVAAFLLGILSVTTRAFRADAEQIAVSTTTLPRPSKEAVGIAEEAAGIRVVSSDAHGVILELVTPAFEMSQDIDDRGPCSLLRVDGYGSSAISGHPELPVMGTLVGIPAHTDVTFTILDADSATLSGYNNLCPVSRPVLDEQPTGEIRYLGTERVRDSNAYATAAFSPAIVAELAGTGFIRSQRVAEVRFYPFQYDPVSGQLRHIRRIRVRVGFTLPPEDNASPQPITAGIQVDEGAFENILAQTIINYEEARTWRTKPRTNRASSDPFAPQAEPPYKITVDRDGMYQLDYAGLQSAGVPVDTLDPRTLKLENLGDEVAIYVAGQEDASFNPGDYILFYGQQTRTKYTDVNAYWLSWGGDDGLRMATLDGAPGGTAPVPSHFQITQRVEEDHYYQSPRPSGPDNDHWYWDYFWATTPTTKTYTTTVRYPAAGPLNATISGLFKGYDAVPNHHTLVYLNGHLVDDATWQPDAEYAFQTTIPQAYIVSGTNTISVAAPLDGGITGDYFFVNRFDIVYHKSYTATTDLLAFSGDVPGTLEYRIGGFASNSLESFDVTDPDRPVRIVNATVSSTNGSYRLDFEHTVTDTHHYIALATSSRKSPLNIVPVAPSDLRSTANGADYIIVTHADFVTAVQPLVDDYIAQGLRTKVVDVQEVYDEFRYGIFNPMAIRDFLAYAYANWTPPVPTYVLLVGDGNYDFKDNFGRGELNYVPPYLADVDPWMGEAAADNRYVSVSGTDILPDMHLGRFAVKTVAEVTAIINKIQSYKQQPLYTGWNAQTLFVTDNPDAAGNFYAFSDAIADNYVPVPYTVQKVYYRQTHTTPSSAKAAIIAAFNDGRLLINYIGHAGVNFWAAEKLLGTTDIAALSNAGRYPFMTPMTCLDGNYIHPSPANMDISSLAESLVRAPNAGAIASWSPTGLGVATGHDIMNQALYKAIFQDDIVELGAATMLGKLALVGQGHDELIDTYLLFGDPALHLNVLPADVSITKTVMPKGAVYPGDTITYTLAYSNVGPATAHHVVISDTLPFGLASPAVTATGATITARVGSAIVWDVADLEAGQGGIITVTATIAPPFTTTLTNTASIETSAVETDTTNNVTPPIVNPVLAPDLAITKSGPVQGKPEQTITYTIAYTNIGTIPAHQVVLSDVLPTPLLTPTFAFSGAAIALRPGTTFVWDVVDLSPGAGGVITVSGTISPAFQGVFTNTASIATTDAEYDLTNNETAPVLTGVSVPDLSILKAGPATAYPGDVITYTLTYSNTGTATAPRAVITDVLPSGTTLYAHSGTIILPTPDNTVTWERYNLAPGDGGTFTVAVTISPTFTGILTNTASIATALFEPNQANNVTPPVLTEVSVPDLIVHKTGPAIAYPGDLITYTLTYTNAGDVTASYVTLVDQLPSVVQLYDHAGTVIMPHPDDRLTWEIFDLAPGASGTLTVTAVISPTFTGWMTNTATIATPLPELNLVGNESRVATHVVPHTIYLPLVMKVYP